MKVKSIEVPIQVIRDQRVILDADLATLYGVPTKVFNQAVKRNLERFPEDFAFQLTAKEAVNLRSQIVTSSLQPFDLQKTAPKSSETKVNSYGGRRYLPWAFTEHGALQAANILRSERAVEMSLYVIRAFVKMREELAVNATILKRLAEIDKTLLEHGSALHTIWTELQPLLQPQPEPPKKRIGFLREEEK